MHPKYHEYVDKLTAKLPDKLNIVYLVNSGSEANELAFLMSRLYTGAQTIVSLRNCYHGGSYATAVATAMSTWKYPMAQPSGYIHVIHAFLHSLLLQINKSDLFILIYYR